jgi:hypothetical protein
MENNTRGIPPLARAEVERILEGLIQDATNQIRLDPAESSTTTASPTASPTSSGTSDQSNGFYVLGMYLSSSIEACRNSRVCFRVVNNALAKIRDAARTFLESQAGEVAATVESAVRQRLRDLTNWATSYIQLTREGGSELEIQWQATPEMMTMIQAEAANNVGGPFGFVSGIFDQAREVMGNAVSSVVSTAKTAVENTQRAAEAVAAEAARLARAAAQQVAEAGAAVVRAAAAAAESARQLAVNCARAALDMAVRNALPPIRDAINRAMQLGKSTLMNRTHELLDTTLQTMVDDITINIRVDTTAVLNELRRYLPLSYGTCAELKLETLFLNVNGGDFCFDLSGAAQNQNAGVDQSSSQNALGAAASSDNDAEPVGLRANLNSVASRLGFDMGQFQTPPFIGNLSMVGVSSFTVKMSSEMRFRAVRMKLQMDAWRHFFYA